MDWSQLIGNHPVLTGGAALAVAGYIVSLVRGVPEKMAKYLWNRVITSIEINEFDPSFKWLETWLAAHPDACRTRAFCVRTDGERVAADNVNGYHDPKCRRYSVTLSPAEGDYFLHHRGRRLWANRERRWFDSAPNGRAFQDTITVKTIAGREVLERFLADIREFSVVGDSGMALLWGCGGLWGHMGYRPLRDGRSIVLQDGCFDSLVREVDEFYRSRDWYRERGVPWNRGYLLGGPPGTGKTSTIVALASQLGLDIATAALTSSDMSDQSLWLLTASLPARTLFVIEDIDALFEARNTKCKVTFPGLLNALDGIGANEGRVLIMTTNHPDKLDPALIRPGRVDRRVEFGNSTPAQAAQMFRWFFRDHGLTPRNLDWLACEFGESIPDNAISPAQIQEHLLRHRDSPGMAAKSPIAGDRPSLLRA